MMVEDAIFLMALSSKDDPTDLVFGRQALHKYYSAGLMPARVRMTQLLRRKHWVGPDGTRIKSDMEGLHTNLRTFTWAQVLGWLIEMKKALTKYRRFTQRWVVLVAGKCPSKGSLIGSGLISVLLSPGADALVAAPGMAEMILADRVVTPNCEVLETPDPLQYREEVDMVVLMGQGRTPPADWEGLFPLVYYCRHGENAMVPFYSPTPF